ncbi:SGNH/GDSL hydrolase family protein [Qipengyuania sp. NPDC077410]|uniref:SGNH/GDSL hydrolase family protein n=1 Tax=Qipengyuania sp. NPDC077410 TaxID=3364496 RepID=UPI0037CC572D
MADFTIRLAGEPIRVNLGESTVEAARQANRAETAADEAVDAASFLTEVVTEQIPLNIDDLAFAVRDPETLQFPFGVRKDARGTIINGHIEEIEAKASKAELSRQEVSPTEDGIAWGVAQRNADGDRALLLGVRDRDGFIINPSFQAVWDAVFGGGGNSSGDLSEADSIIMHGPHMFAVEGRAIEYYASSLLPNRNTNPLSRVLTVQSAEEGRTPVGVVFRDYARIEGRDLGSTARIKLQNASLARTIEVQKDVTVIKSSASKTGSPRVMTIGDSITSQISALLPAALAQTDLTPAFVGTLLSTDGVTRHEGRSGWAARNYTYEDPVAPSGTALPPLAAGNEAAYLNMSAGTANLLNPFIREATGGDDPAKVFNGYVFDFRFYLDRFGYPDPDVIVINLGTNDWMTGELATVPARMMTAFNSVQLMVTQIKAACPGCKIGLAIPQTGSNSFFDPRYFQGYAELFLRYHEAYGAAAGDGIYLLNTHAMSESRFMQVTDAVSTNARTGQTKRQFNGDVHPGDFLGRPQLTEGYLAFIHAIS